jgi:hypothetical protein
VDLELCDSLNCPRDCTDDIDPICAFDGREYREFSNECLLSEHNECNGNSNPSMYKHKLQIFCVYG